MIIDLGAWPRWLRTVAIVAFAIAAVGLAGYYVTAAGDIDTTALEDFGLHDHRDAVYYPAQATLDGQVPYDTPEYLSAYPAKQHFPVYSPGFVTLHLPFGMLPITWSAVLYGALLLVAFVFLAHTALRVSGIEPRVWAVLGISTALLATQPATHNLVVGNNGVLFAALATVLIYDWHTNPRRAGSALAAATGKPQFAIGLVVLSAARRGGRQQWLTAAIVAAVLTGPLLVLYISWAGGVGDFIDVIRGNLDEATTAASSAEGSRIDLAALVGRITGTDVPSAITLAGNVMTLAAAAFAVRRFDRLDDGRHLVAATMVLATALTGVHQSYDGVVLAVPAAALFLSTSGWQGLSRRHRIFLQVAFVVAAYNHAAAGWFGDRVDLADWVFRAIRSVGPAFLVVSLASLVVLAARSTAPQPAIEVERSPLAV